MENKIIITKEMLIDQVIKKYPKTILVFMEYGLHCVGCFASMGETIEEAAVLHHLELDKLLDSLNKSAE